jgi:hypothetical protein
MAIFLVLVAAAAGALAIWCAVRFVNLPNRREWMVRVLFPRLLVALIGYFLVSAATIPFAGNVWLGEIPLLALIQIPIVVPAKWCQDLVILGMHSAGLSSGSASPDLIASRPWGLFLAYLLVLGPIFAAVWYWTRMRPPYGRLAIMLALVAAIDFFLILFLAGWPGFSMY